MENSVIDSNSTVSASDVRKILDTDNSGIKDLCRKLKVFPKRDKETGKAFFLRDDVEFLKRMKDLHAQSGRYSEIDQRPLYNAQPGQALAIPQSFEKNQLLLINEFRTTVEKMLINQDKLIERMQSTLEDKLDGLDEVVVELIQAKTENENLRIKLNQLTKENYELKSNIEAFRPIGFGLYVK